VKVQKLVLSAIGVYQVVRFFVLALTILVQESIVTDPIIRNGIVAFSAGGLVTAVLVLQYVVTGAYVLIVPLRIAKLLELSGDALLYGSLLFGQVTVAQRIAFRGVAPILFITDTIVFLFLLLLSQKES
jgi:hypothetical protein